MFEVHIPRETRYFKLPMPHISAKRNCWIMLYNRGLCCITRMMFVVLKSFIKCLDQQDFSLSFKRSPRFCRSFFSCLCYRLLKVINQADADAWTKWKMLSYIFETVPILHGSSWCQTFNKWINPNFRGETKILMALKMEMKLMTEMTDGHRWKETMLGIAAISRTFEMTLAVWKFSAMIFTSFFFSHVFWHSLCAS